MKYYTKKKHSKYYRRKVRNMNRKTKMKQLKHKKINSNTIKDLQKKFSRARQRLQYSRYINREQIGCSTNKNYMKGGTSPITQIGYAIEDGVNRLSGDFFGTNIKFCMNHLFLQFLKF